MLISKLILIRNFYLGCPRMHFFSITNMNDEKFNLSFRLT